MEIKLDINGTINRSKDILTRISDYWSGFEFPGNIGPALSHMITLGVFLAIAQIVSGILLYLGLMIGVGFGIGFGFLFNYIILQPVLIVAFFVGMPILMGILLNAIAPALNIDKGDVNSFTTIVAYSTTPSVVAAILSALLFGLMGFIGYAAKSFGLFGLIGMLAGLIALAGGIVSLIVHYNGFVKGLNMESGQAILLIVIEVIIYGIIYAILFAILNAITGVPVFYGSW